MQPRDIARGETTLHDPGARPAAAAVAWPPLTPLVGVWQRRDAWPWVDEGGVAELRLAEAPGPDRASLEAQIVAMNTTLLDTCRAGPSGARRSPPPVLQAGIQSSSGPDARASHPLGRHPAVQILAARHIEKTEVQAPPPYPRGVDLKEQECHAFPI
jgi:hypothetical protein